MKKQDTNISFRILFLATELHLKPVSSGMNRYQHKQGRAPLYLRGSSDRSTRKYSISFKKRRRTVCRTSTSCLQDLESLQEENKVFGFFCPTLTQPGKKKSTCKGIYTLLHITLFQTLQKLTNTIILQPSKAQQ